MNFKYITYLIFEEIKNHPDYIFENNKWKYIGKLGIHLIEKYKIHWLAYKAYKDWCGQGARTTNKNCISYKYYKSKNSKRIWDSRTSINWWINEFFKREGWNCPCVCRKGDKGNYEIDNVDLKEKSENNSEKEITDKIRNKAREVSKENFKNFRGWNRKKFKIINIDNLNENYIFNSSFEAGKFLNKNPGIIRYKALQNKILKVNNKRYKIINMG